MAALIHRRGFLTGLLAMPAIIRTPGLLMPVRPERLADSELMSIILNGPFIWRSPWVVPTKPVWALTKIS